MAKKGKKNKMLPWVRKWRRTTTEQTFYEDYANFEKNLARNAFTQVLVQHRPHLRRVRRRELYDQMRQTEMRLRQQVDRQDETLGFLMTDMHEAYAQEQLLARRHTAALTRLGEIHDNLKKFMEEEFYGNLRTLLAELCAKTNMLTKQNDEDLKKLEIMRKIMDEEWAEEETDRRTKFLTSVDEIKNRIMEEKQILRIQMEHVISALYQKMEDEYVKYKNRTEEKLARYQELRAKDEISSKEVKYQVMRINMLSKQVAMRKTKLAAFRQSAEIKMRYWDELKGRLKAATSVVKRKIRFGNVGFQRQYNDMTMNFQNAQNQLNALEKVGVRLVRNALVCHRMQDPDDKLFASTRNHLTEKEKEWLADFKSQKPKYSMNQDIDEVLHMTPFMMNNAHVEVKNIAQSYENRQLRSQNSRLESLIGEYIGAKTVTDNAFDPGHANPLMTVTRPTYVVVDKPLSRREKYVKPTTTIRTAPKAAPAQA